MNETKTYQIPEIAIRMQRIAKKPGNGSDAFTGVFFENDAIVVTDGAMIVVKEHEQDAENKVPCGKLWRFRDSKKYKNGKPKGVPTNIEFTAIGDKERVSINAGNAESIDTHSYPPYKQVFPEYVESDRLQVSIDVGKLVKMASILSANDVVTLSIDKTNPEHSMIIVFANTEEDAVGGVMPMKHHVDRDCGEQIKRIRGDK